MEMEYSKSIKDTVNIFVVFEENIFQSQNHQNTLILKKGAAVRRHLISRACTNFV